MTEESVVPDEARLVTLPRHPVLDDFAGQTLGENLDHITARAVLLAGLVESDVVAAASDAIMRDLGVEAALDRAIDALEAIAQRAGLPSRFELFSTEPVDVEVTADEIAAIDGLQVAKQRAAREIGSQLRVLIQSLGLPWPWLQYELMLAFEVGIDGELDGRPRTIVIRGGEEEPLVDRSDVEIDALHIAVGTPLSEGLSMIEQHERQARDARSAMEAMLLPAMPRGRVRAKTTEVLVRNVEWLLASRVTHESIAAIARRSFDGDVDRRKDVRAGIAQAEHILGLGSYQYDPDGEIVLRSGIAPVAPTAREEFLHAMRGARGDPAKLAVVSTRASVAGHHDLALEAADAALAASDGSVVALVAKANALRDAGRTEEAHVVAEQARASDPGNRGALHAYSAALREIGRLRDAETALTEELALNESLGSDAAYRAHLLSDRGTVRKGLGDLGGARADFDAAIDCDPDAVVALIERAQLLLEADSDDDRAEHDLRRAAELDPSRPDGWNLLGILYTGQRAFTKARMALDRAVAADPTYSAGFVNLGVLLNLQGRSRPALRAFEQAAEVDPLNPYAHTNVGIWYAARDRWQEALEHAMRAVAVDALYLPGVELLGVSLLALDRAPEAVARLSAVVERVSDRPEPYQALITALVKSGDLDKAVSVAALMALRFPGLAPTIEEDGDLAPLYESPVHRRMLNALVQADHASDQERSRGSRTEGHPRLSRTGASPRARPPGPRASREAGPRRPRR